MIKKVVAVTVLLLLMFHCYAFAGNSGGDIIFRDALYGATIGAILGGAIYLIDQNNFAAKFGTGVAVGTVGGLLWSAVRTKSLAEIKGDDLTIALPTPIIQERDNGILYSVSILNVDF